MLNTNSDPETLPVAREKVRSRIPESAWKTWRNRRLSTPSRLIGGLLARTGIDRNPVSPRP